MDKQRAHMHQNGQETTPRLSGESWLSANRVHLGHTPRLLKNIESDTISLSVWSPPYFVGKEYEKDLTFDAWQGLLRDTISAHFRILRPGAFLAVNIGDILAFRDPEIPRIQAPNTSKLRSPVSREDVLNAKRQYPNYNRDQLAKLLACSEQTIDRRLNGNNIRGGKYATQTRVLLVGHFIEKYAREAQLYLYDRRVWVKDAAWQNSQWHSSSYRSVDEFEHIYVFWKPGETIVDRNRLSPDEWVKWGSRGVWTFPSVRVNDVHEAMFPIELPRRLIQLLTDKGDVVLDAFVGSGTTAVAAVQLGRQYIGLDNQKKYVELAERRIKEERDKMGYLFEI